MRRRVWTTLPAVTGKKARWNDTYSRWATYALRWHFKLAADAIVSAREFWDYMHNHLKSYCLHHRRSKQGWNYHKHKWASWDDLLNEITSYKLRFQVCTGRDYGKEIPRGADPCLLYTSDAADE